MTEDKDWSGVTAVRFVADDGSDFDGWDMSGSTFNESTWGKGTRLNDTALRWAIMRRSTFEGVSFTNCDMAGIDLSGSTFLGEGRHACRMTGVELDMANLCGVDMRRLQCEQVALEHRIVFVDADTRLPQDPHSGLPTDFGRELATLSLTQEQFSDYTDGNAAAEMELRDVLATLSPAFIPVYTDGTMGQRGELVERAMRGEDVRLLGRMQAELWQRSRFANPLLVEDVDAAFARA